MDQASADASFVHHEERPSWMKPGDEDIGSGVTNFRADLLHRVAMPDSKH